MTDYNENQNRAITAPLAHMAINAAAGTGKTSTLAARIQYLQAELNLLPNSIMAISFSRTARSRLIEKLKELCKKTKFGSTVPSYTFHGLSFRILRIAAGMGESWLKPGFEIIDSLSRENNPIFRRHSSLLNGVFKQLDRETAWEACMKAIDSLRQGSDEMEPCFVPEELDSNVLVEVDIGQNTLIRLKSAEVLTVWRRYENMLKQYNIIDYWGLIVEAVNILSQPETETRKRVRENLRAIVVDEYQDTSRAQEKLLFALAGNDIPVNVVGDIDQTIYTFNGSSASNMANFLSMATQTDISVLASISMTENYRSATPILELANRIRKELTDDRKLLPASNLSDKNIALYRKRNFPVRLVYAPKLELAADFVAKEINRLVNAEGIDNIAVLVRKDSEYSPQARAVREALDLFEIKNDVMSIQTQKNRHEHFQFLYGLCQDPEHYGKSLSDLISTDLKITLPLSMTNEQFHSYIHEALESGASYCYEAVDFLFDNMTTEDSDEQGNYHIKIRTVHSAKGEEFRVVFLLYLGDRSFPHGSQPDLDEERRLFYVGITRAQERLYVIGRPGIHFESFFDNCKGPNTSYLEYSVLGGKTSDEKETRFDTEIAASIEQARTIQQAREKEERENLWRLFEEEY
ncbi:ATP-dependent helicase [Paenibacillus sp. OSY-SE]|uniref:ATP-dependent helicase n=1 Tax=Paenibacillus sp. OSY-SE TaxID=1196323 RepID=UPI00031DA1F5|nr:ATP-dependent helicase [Paenibacillus sp. OSY-SE]